ncbi:hypothetical protein CONCODRAFT_77457, partial [Conidiobolus coronatus NRRL 28638]
MSKVRLGHFSLPVTNLLKSHNAYKQIFAALGEPEFMEYPKYVGYLKGDFGLLEEPKVVPIHAAIKVMDKHLVKIGYDAAMGVGFTCNGKPGLRSEWNCEMSFFKDFDNNRLEFYYEY